MSKKLKRKCIRAVVVYPWCLMIMANGWWKLIGVAAFIYIIVSAICTWIDEAREERSVK